MNSTHNALHRLRDMPAVSVALANDTCGRQLCTTDHRRTCSTHHGAMHTGGVAGQAARMVCSTCMQRCSIPLRRRSL